MAQTESPTIRHRFKRFVLTLVFIFGLFLAAIFGVAFYLSPQDPLQKSDVIVVISGGQTSSRAERGIELYKQGYAPKLIFSGAAIGTGPSNARQMRQQALRAGVPDQDILTDEIAETTYQNAVKTKSIVDQLSAKQILLVTSPYHQRRSSITFQRVYGNDYRILNESAFDNRWSKVAWWATPFGVSITISELIKVGYIYATQQFE